MSKLLHPTRHIRDVGCNEGKVSFGEECRLVNFGPRAFDKIDMTLGQGQKPWGTRENGKIKVVFLLGKSVERYNKKIGDYKCQ